MAKFFTFPNPVNEKAARTVATGVVTLTVITLLTQSWIPLVILTLGFWGRVLAGPKLSPLGWVSQRVIAPKLGPAILVPGPPKRFAQGIGTAFTTAATILYFSGQHTAAWIVLAVLLVAAGLEAFAGFCFGCFIFGYLQKWGLIPESVCEACNDIRKRNPAIAEAAARQATQQEALKTPADHTV